MSCLRRVLRTPRVERIFGNFSRATLFVVPWRDGSARRAYLFDENANGRSVPENDRRLVGMDDDRPRVCQSAREKHQQQHGGHGGVE